MQLVFGLIESERFGSKERRKREREFMVRWVSHVIGLESRTV